MDSDTRSAQVARLEGVETCRRRRWSEDEKLKIVLESLQKPRQVAATARRYGISRSLLLRWRRLFRPEPNDEGKHPVKTAQRSLRLPDRLVCFGGANSTEGVRRAFGRDARRGVPE